MYIILAILVFVLLIITHELGHFCAAKLSGVRVLEFAVGMGPVLVQKEVRGTVYSLRCLPLGGFCSMEGEEEQSDAPDSFTRAGLGKKLFILISGAAMNFLTGFLLVVLLLGKTPVFSVPVITDFFDGCPYEASDGLQTGDRILSVNGHRLHFISDLDLYVGLGSGEGTDLVLIRSGSRVKLENYPLEKLSYPSEGEGTYYGLRFARTESGFPALIKYSWYRTLDFVDMVWIGLSQLVSGQVGLRDMSGVVGVVATMNDAAHEAPTRASAFYIIFYLSAFIAVNLAVMNLLPLPALDGGHVLSLLLVALIERIIGRSLDPKYEQFVHAAGLMLLLGLMLVILASDILKLIVR